MKSKQLTFFQTFNALRIFLDMHYDVTLSDKIGTMASALNIWKKKSDWKENPDTFDPTAWQDWMKAVHKVLQELNIYQEPTKIILNDEIAFLCLQNYIQIFYDQTPWEDVGSLLNKVKHAQHSNSDPVWQQWLQAIDHSINETYELDVYFDPFTGKRM